MAHTTDGHRVLSEHEQMVALLQEHSALLQEISTGIDALGGALSALEMGLRSISDKLASNAERTSSVEVKTSTRGVDVTAKAYAGSDIKPAGDAAVIEYFTVVDQVEAELQARKQAAA